MVFRQFDECTMLATSVISKCVVLIMDINKIHTIWLKYSPDNIMFWPFRLSLGSVVCTKKGHLR